MLIFNLGTRWDAGLGPAYGWVSFCTIASTRWK